MRSKSRSDLSRRVIVAVPAATVVVVITILSQTLLALALIIFGWLCLQEFWQIAERRGLRGNSLIVVLSCSIFAAMMVVVLLLVKPTLIAAVVVLAPSILVVFAMMAVVAWAKEEEGYLALPQHIIRQQNENLMKGLLWIGIPLTCAVLLRGMHHGAWLVVDVVLVVSVCDSGAYLGGRKFGRRKLAPTISPNKTVAGWVIGILAAVVAIGLFSQFQTGWLPLWQALVFGLVVALVSTIGDLVESAMKRKAGLDDSGTLFGAHGGALDRSDSYLFGAAIGYALALLFGL